MARSIRNEGYQKVRAALDEGGYQVIALHGLRDADDNRIGDVRFFSNGSEVLILKTDYEGKDVSGYDVYAPITSSNRVDDTVAAIKARF